MSLGQLPYTGRPLDLLARCARCTAGGQKGASLDVSWTATLNRVDRSTYLSAARGALQADDARDRELQGTARQGGLPAARPMVVNINR
jgi:hypothetical protein